MLKEGLGDLTRKQISLTHQKRKKRELHRAKILTAKKHRFQKEFLLKRHQPPKHPPFLLVVGTAISRAFNPQTYTQIHSPTVVQGKRGLPLP